MLRWPQPTWPGRAWTTWRRSGGSGPRDVAEVGGGGCRTFDLVFIDADKANIPEYVEWSIRLSRPGSVIVVDNVVRNGALLEDSGQKPDVVGVRRLHEALSSDKRVSATTIQTVGAKGYDGFTLAVVLG
jgi:predicted O-methyltransferase YrrM